MKQFVVFLVLVGLAVPGWGGSTDVSHDVKWWADTLKVLFRGVPDPWDVDTSWSFFLPASLIYLGSTESSLFDSVWVFPPKRCPDGGMVLRLKGFYVTPRHPSVAGWPEIYHIYADTIICKGRCKELTSEEILEWLGNPDPHELLPIIERDVDKEE